VIISARTATTISMELCFLTIFTRFSRNFTSGLAIIAIIQPMTNGRKNFKKRGPIKQTSQITSRGMTILRINLQYFFQLFIIITCPHYTPRPEPLQMKKI